jgi:uncharacterized protein with HEPN domain
VESCDLCDEQGTTCYEQNNSVSHSFQSNLRNLLIHHSFQSDLRNLLIHHSFQSDLRNLLIHHSFQSDLQNLLIHRQAKPTVCGMILQPGDQCIAQPSSHAFCCQKEKARKRKHDRRVIKIACYM